MTSGSTTSCASCAAALSSTDRFCPSCGHDQQVATVDLGLIGQSPDATPDVSTADTSSKRLPVLAGIGAAIVALVVLFSVLGGSDDAPPSAIAEESTAGQDGDGNSGADDEEDIPSSRAVLSDTEVSSVAGSEASFPLFPQSERQLIIGRRADMVVLIDAETGAIQRLPLRSAVGFELATDDAPATGYSIGSNGERLLVVDNGTMRSFSLTGGADFELSGNVVAFDIRQGPRVVVGSQLSGVAPRTIYEVQAFGAYEVFPSETGIVPFHAEIASVGERVFVEAGGQVFEHMVDIGLNGGFAEIADGKLLGSGRNHVIVDRCDVELTCQPVIVPTTEPGDDQAFELPLLSAASVTPTAPLRLSPNADWVVATIGGGLDASTIDQSSSISLPTSTLLSVSWTTDGRYLVASGSGSVTIVDTTTLETSNIDIDGTGQRFDELLIVPAPPGWTPQTE